MLRNPADAFEEHRRLYRCETDGVATNPKSRGRNAASRGDLCGICGTHGSL